MFDWNSSPLSVEAARQRAAKDAEIRVRTRRAKEKRPPLTAEERHENGRAVKHACSAWLAKRGLPTGQVARLMALGFTRKQIMERKLA